MRLLQAPIQTPGEGPPAGILLSVSSAARLRAASAKKSGAAGPAYQALADRHSHTAGPERFPRQSHCRSHRSGRFTSDIRPEYRRPAPREATQARELMGLPEASRRAAVASFHEQNHGSSPALKTFYGWPLRDHGQNKPVLRDREPPDPAKARVKVGTHVSGV
jgi:hypothetical protein